MSARFVRSNSPVRLYLYGDEGLIVIGTGEKAGAGDVLSTAPSFNFSHFTNADFPHGYAIDAVNNGHGIEADDLPGFVESQSLEYWSGGRPKLPEGGSPLRPLDFCAGMLFRGYGCTHKKSSAERQRMMAGGQGEAVREYGPRNLPNPATHPYEAVRYDPARPEVFDKASASEQLGVGGGGAIGLIPAQHMVSEAERGWAMSRRLSANKPPRIWGKWISNDVTGHSIEGANTLYLPQAKVFEGCLSAGPCVSVLPEPFELTEDGCREDSALKITDDDLTISLKLLDKDGKVKFEGSSTLDTLRPMQWYLAFAFHHRPNVRHIMAQSGTGIIHPKGVGLEPGDTIVISSNDAGTLITGAEMLEESWLDRRISAGEKLR